MRSAPKSKKIAVIALGISLVIFSGCSFFNDVSKQAQEQASGVQKTVSDTIDKTGKTLNDAKTKVENVTNAATNLQKSLDDLQNWSGNGNANKK